VSEHPASIVCGIDAPHSDGRELSFEHRWRTEAVVGLARGIRADQAFDRMPILADALEEAGCDERAILDHCRACQWHVMGCWVVEAVLEVVDRRATTPAPRPTVFARVFDGMSEELRLTNWFRIKPASSPVPARERHWANLGCGMIQAAILAVVTILALCLIQRFLIAP
jgi:hypothetical protein